MGDLKPGWRRVKFGDVVRLNRDTSKDPASDGLERYVGLEHIEPGDMRVRSWGDISDGTTFTNRFRPGHVLFGKRRAYQRKLAVADFEGVCSGDIYVFEPKDPTVLLPELLPFICQTDAFFELAVGTSAGSLSPRTNWKSLAAYEFALPPLLQQHSMVRAMNCAWRTVETLYEAERTIHRLRESTLMHWFARGPSLSGTEIAPSAWSDATRIEHLEDLVEADAPVCYGVVQRGKHVENGVPAITISDLGTDYSGAFRIESRIDNEYRRSRVREGDILLAIKATIGPIDIVPEGFEGNIQRQIARVRLRNLGPLDLRYFYWLWQSPPFRRYVSSLVVGSTRAELSIARLKRLEVPVPPAARQREVIDIMEAIASTAAATSDRLARSRRLFSRCTNLLIVGSGETA